MRAVELITILSSVSSALAGNVAVSGNVAANTNTIFKCETVQTYSAEDRKKTCMGATVSYACFSLVPTTGWQCFDDAEEAAKGDCRTIRDPNGDKYDGGCVYARDYTFWGKVDGSDLQVRAAGENAACGRSMFGLLVITALAILRVWQ